MNTLKAKDGVTIHSYRNMGKYIKWVLNKQEPMVYREEWYLDEDGFCDTRHPDVQVPLPNHQYLLDFLEEEKEYQRRKSEPRRGMGGFGM